MKSKAVELSNKLLDLTLSIDRAEAVAQSFAERYIDVDTGTKHSFVVAMSEDNFENLYNALHYMLHDIAQQAEETLKEAEELVHAERSA